jgi:hypothetical protein
MRPCPRRDEPLDYLDGCLDEAGSQLIEQHVESCPGCTAALEQLTSGDSDLPFPLVASADTEEPSRGWSDHPASGPASTGFGSTNRPSGPGSGPT